MSGWVRRTSVRYVSLGVRYALGKSIMTCLVKVQLIKIFFQKRVKFEVRCLEFFLLEMKKSILKVELRCRESHVRSL